MEKTISNQSELMAALETIGIKPQPRTVPPIGISIEAIPLLVKVLNEKGYQVSVGQFTAVLNSPV